jgi:hypothetical protein
MSGSKPIVMLVTAQAALPFPSGKHTNLTGFYKKLHKLLPTKPVGRAHFIDMHNVLDLFDPTDSPFDDDEDASSFKMCVSWVGNVTGGTAQGMIPDMQERIRANQIHFGIICSKRGQKPRRQKGSDQQKAQQRAQQRAAREPKAAEVMGRAICTEPGSKADLVRTMLQKMPKCKAAAFYDDAADHCASVQSLGLAKLRVFHIRPKIEGSVAQAVKAFCKAKEEAKDTASPTTTKEILDLAL